MQRQTVGLEARAVGPDITAVRRVLFVIRDGKTYKWVGSRAARGARQ